MSLISVFYVKCAVQITYIFILHNTKPNHYKQIYNLCVKIRDRNWGSLVDTFPLLCLKFLSCDVVWQKAKIGGYINVNKIERKRFRLSLVKVFVADEGAIIRFFFPSERQGTSLSIPFHTHSFHPLRCHSLWPRFHVRLWRTPPKLLLFWQTHFHNSWVLPTFFNFSSQISLISNSTLQDYVYISIIYYNLVYIL